MEATSSHLSRARSVAGTSALRWRRRGELVHASTRITHTDERAEDGALAVAHAAALAVTSAEQPPSQLLQRVRDSLRPCEMADLIDQASDLADAPSEEFASKLGLERGVTGFVNHTVPIALHCWARQPRCLETAVTEIIRLGGDTDTTGAIVGGLVGAGTGPTGIPPSWLAGLSEWPRTVRYMRRLAAALAGNGPAPALFWPGVLARNALFTTGVYGLILRRALPPW